MASSKAAFFVARVISDSINSTHSSFNATHLPAAEVIRAGNQLGESLITCSITSSFCSAYEVTRISPNVSLTIKNALPKRSGIRSACACHHIQERIKKLIIGK